MNKKELTEKLTTACALIDECLQYIGERPTKNKLNTVEGSKKTQEVIISDDLVLSIVNKIGECDENAVLQSKILDKKNMEAKILLCFYISYTYFNNAWLTSRDVEGITSEVGIKIDTRNASNKLKAMRGYLESGASRKRGQSTPYRINRRGVQRFQEIIH